MCVFSSSFCFWVSLEQLGGGGFLANLRNFEDENTNGSLFVQIICIFIGDTFKFQAKHLKTPALIVPTISLSYLDIVA